VNTAARASYERVLGFTNKKMFTGNRAPRLDLPKTEHSWPHAPNETTGGAEAESKSKPGCSSILPDYPDNSMQSIWESFTKSSFARVLRSVYRFS
jgi:hypothetical protein